MIDVVFHSFQKVKADFLASLHEDSGTCTFHVESLKSPDCFLDETIAHLLLIFNMRGVYACCLDSIFEFLQKFLVRSPQVQSVCSTHKLLDREEDLFIDTLTDRRLTLLKEDQGSQFELGVS